MPSYTFTGIIRKNQDSDTSYNITFPDVPGIKATTSDIDKLILLGTKQLIVVLKSMYDQGLIIPTPRTFTKVREDIPKDNSELALVPVQVTIPAKSVHINITLPELLVADIDLVAESSGLTRSGLISHVMSTYITSNVLNKDNKDDQ